jgi:hypothetical protein
MKPEEQTEILLYGWLRSKVKEIYFNKKNIISAPTFQVKGLNFRRIPDLIILTNSGNYISVEIKPTSKDNSKVQEGQSQLFEDQYLNYIESKIQILINNKIIKIDSFILATDDSLNSSIFKLN